jgi:hypothetical protein
MKSFLFTLALSLLIPFIALSQWSTDPAVNNAINNMSGEQAIPKIATCSNGYSYIASFSVENGNYNMRMQRVNAQGVPQWADDGILISDNAQDTWLTDWDMCVDNANYAILAFPDIRTGTTNIVAYRISPSGSFAWGDDGIVLSTGDGNYSPTVSVTSAGNAIVAWSQDAVAHYQKITASGNLPWGSSGFMLSQTGYTFASPQTMPVGTDEFLMKYFRDQGSYPNLTREVYVQRYNAGGSAVWSSAATVSNAGGISPWTQDLPFINDGSDGCYIAWHDDRDNNLLSSTYVNHISSTGTVLFQANGVEASTMGGRNHFYPQLALPPGSSNVYVFWNEMDGDQNNRGIYGQKLSSTGTRLWATTGMVFIEISPTDVYPEAARNSPTDVVLFYSIATGGSNYDLKAFRVNSDGAYMWSPSSKPICTAASSKVHVYTNNFANNQWIQAWEDNRDGETDLYAQNIQLDGSLGPYDPQEGTIEGTVTLVGGTADVTQVTVTAGESSTNPDENGFYSMVVTQGTYQVIGNLVGYIPDTVNSVTVVTGETTNGVDLTLEALPTGFIFGNVTLNGGTGDVTDVQVVAGYHTVHPDSQGNYTMEIEIGTYDVTAGLADYLPQTDSGIVVQEGMTTIGVDFILDPVPTTGFITGNVMLSGGTGDVTQVAVTAGNVTVNPDENGDYVMEIVAGTYEVTASLAGYWTVAVTGVVVEVEQTTPDVNFILLPIPDVGYIQGSVTLIGEGDVTLATVTAGTQSTHPSSNGYYFLSVPAGTYTVTADHPYTDPESLTDIVVTAGQNTENVDFELEINRADMIVKALDGNGDPVNGVNVDINGPGFDFSGTITEDSLFFEAVSYGEYTGVATIEGWEQATVTDTINAEDHDIIFNLIPVGIDEKDASLLNLNVSPNPSHGNVSITFGLDGASNITLDVYSQQGQLIRRLSEGKMAAGNHRIEWNGADNAGQTVNKGTYLVVLRTGKAQASRVVIIQ